MAKRGPGVKTRLQRNILMKRGLAKGRFGSIVLASETMRTGNGKTLAMRLLEDKFDKDIIELLAYDNRKEVTVAKQLGIAQSTVSMWRLKLGLRSN